MIKAILYFYLGFFSIMTACAEQMEGHVKLGEVLIELRKDTSLIYYNDNFISKSVILPGGGDVP